MSPHGIAVDQGLRTSLPHVYAAGDVAGGAQFTHYAVWQGYAAARNALFPRRTRGIRTPVPWAVFTDPEVAEVGLTEEEAKASGGRRVEVHRWPLGRIDRAQTDGDTGGFLKLFTDRGDRLLGATIVSAGAARPHPQRPRLIASVVTPKVTAMRQASSSAGGSSPGVGGCTTRKGVSVASETTANSR